MAITSTTDLPSPGLSNTAASGDGASFSPPCGSVIHTLKRVYLIGNNMWWRTTSCPGAVSKHNDKNSNGPGLSTGLPLYFNEKRPVDSPSLSSRLNFVPMGLWPYIELVRLEKPTGSLLMFWPFAWGLTMAAHRTHLLFEIYVTYLVQFAIYAALLRGSACTVNDILDVKYDAAVERTKSRPLPSGRISKRPALVFLVFQYILSVTFLALTLPTLGLSVALIQLLPVFAVYPLLKRITHWPQAWLGIAMNLGFLVAWTTVTGTFEYWVVIPALMGCWCWTMLYDTIYACQDIRDDVKAGVRSTAILFGEWIRPLLVLCGVIFLQMLIVVGYLNEHGLIYYAITVGGTALYLVMQYKTVNLTDPKSCWRNFNHNGRLGFIIWAGLLMDYHNQIEQDVFSLGYRDLSMVS